MKKQLKRLGGFYVDLVMFVPADLVIFFGLFLQQLRPFLLPTIDEDTYIGMWTMWGYDVMAGYYVTVGVIFYFSRYFIRWNRKRKTAKSAL